ncbi:hypothetical protein OKJ48_11425 [Streptomyces kunmingensis]|uniref:Uncharacterized protein n=1 Tax=Streptomyces kunmingensis TaxID=68225 RepID=A0ABU6C805_9ACTN|nr:hypothetical protein [Streptomyces kunmingensis]MEB3960849.1 hypothetical protein [Streptomyces kunmingensis]
MKELSGGAAAATGIVVPAASGVTDVDAVVARPSGRGPTGDLPTRSGAQGMPMPEEGIECDGRE